MKEIDFSTIYNIPEGLSPSRCIANFLGCSLYIGLMIVVIPDILGNTTIFRDLIETIISCGIWVTLGWIFILIICPIYFFIGFIIELYRYKKFRKDFYSTPHIEYIKLNSNGVFFKNTCKNHDFIIRRSEVTEVVLNGNIKPYTSTSGFDTTSVENLTMTIKTQNNTYTIYPQIKYEQVKRYIDPIDLLQHQIAFYKGYFNNFHENIFSGGLENIDFKSLGIAKDSDSIE